MLVFEILFVWDGLNLFFLINLSKWGKWSGHTLPVSPEAHFVSPHFKIQPPKFCLGQRSQCSTACFGENPLQKGCVQKAVCRAVRRLTPCLLVHPSFSLGVIGVSHGGELTSWFSPDPQYEQNDRGLQTAVAPWLQGLLQQDTGNWNFCVLWHSCDNSYWPPAALWYRQDRADG